MRLDFIWMSWCFIKNVMHILYFRNPILMENMYFILLYLSHHVLYKRSTQYFDHFSICKRRTFFISHRHSTFWHWGNYLNASVILFCKNSNEATRLDDFEHTPRLTTSRLSIASCLSMVDVSAGHTIAFRNIYEVNIMVGYLIFIMR